MSSSDFGDLLRDFREQQGLSLRELAKVLGTDPGYLSRLENGKSGRPRETTVRDIAHALCHHAGLSDADCDGLRRQLMVAAGHALEGADLMDDLEARFAARLRTEGLSEQQIDEALAHVPLSTMRAVLLGDEPLEIGNAADYSHEVITQRQRGGESALSLSAPSAPGSYAPHDEDPDVSESLLEMNSVADPGPETANNYLKRNAERFTARRRAHRRTSGSRPVRTIRAGDHAEIHVRRPLDRDQQLQLRLIAKLIESIMNEEK